MATIMEELTTGIMKIVINEVNTQLLPLISEKYSIPLEELIDFVNLMGQNKIVAKPKASVTKKPVSNNTQLLDKINKAKEQNKIFNVSTGRPINDTPDNRKKYTFFTELGVAGLPNDEKLTNALKQLDFTKEETEAEEPKQEPKEEETQAEEPKEEPKQEEPKQEEPKQEPKQKAVKKSEKQAPEKQTIKQEKPSVEEQEPVHKQAEKAKKKALEVVNQEVKKSTDSYKEVSDDDQMETVLKISDLIDEKPVNSNIKPVYHKQLRIWWNPESTFILDRRGNKFYVTGKIIDGKVQPLNEEDLKKCKKNGWDTNLPKHINVKTLTKDDDDD
jgi:chemotaxis protein histidine kinase CheA